MKGYAAVRRQDTGSQRYTAILHRFFMYFWISLDWDVLLNQGTIFPGPNQYYSKIF